jgi:hypothetical protein
MNLDELRLKRLREAVGATRELRHTTQAARKHVAAAIRLQRAAGNRLRRKLVQLDNLFSEQANVPSYTLDDYVSDLLNALTYERDRLIEVEKGLDALRKKLTKRVESGKAQSKVEGRKSARQKRADEKKTRITKQARLHALATVQRDTIKSILERAKASGDPELVTHIQKQVIQAKEMPKVVPNIIQRLTERGLDEYAADFRRWLDVIERREELGGK